MCLRASACHTVHVEIRELLEVGFRLPPGGSWEWNSAQTSHCPGERFKKHTGSIISVIVVGNHSPRKRDGIFEENLGGGQNWYPRQERPQAAISSSAASAALCLAKLPCTSRCSK